MKCGGSKERLIGEFDVDLGRGEYINVMKYRVGGSPCCTLPPSVFSLALVVVYCRT